MSVMSTVTTTATVTYFYNTQQMETFFLKKTILYQLIPPVSREYSDKTSCLEKTFTKRVKEEKGKMLKAVVFWKQSGLLMTSLDMHHTVSTMVFQTQNDTGEGFRVCVCVNVNSCE